MSRKIGIAMVTGLLMASSSIAFAQTRPLNAGFGLGQERAILQPTLSALNMQNRIEQRRVRAQDQIQQIQENVRARNQQLRVRAQERISQIQDKQKQKLAQNLSGQFDHLNQVWTKHFAQVLDHLATILQKIQDRANFVATKGQNISATNTAIQSAQTAIAAAQSAVATQAAKSYELVLPVAATDTTATSTATSTPVAQTQLIQDIRASAQSLRAELFKDLFALHTGPMLNARTAVQSALQALSQIPGVDAGNATSTVATSTNQ